jgi:SAM-dependent methyltransferase
MTKEQRHKYEKTQEFNLITRILHRTRYAILEKLVLRIHKECSGTLKVVDVGCGPAHSYQVLTKLGVDFNFTGIELREDFCELAKSRYGVRDNFTIICDSIENQFDKFEGADLIIGLESFEHIPEWLVVRTVEALKKTSFKYLYITVPNEVGPAILIKNVGSFLMGYTRYKEYSWAETFYASIYELDKVARHGTGHKGFDWRWLAQTLRQNVKIITKTTSPLKIIPKFLSPSIGFICVKSD